MTTHVVVVGAGFGGLTAARRLVRNAARRDLRLTLVDRHNYHTFQPLLYQVATSGLQPQDIGHSVRSIFGLRGEEGDPRLAFRMGEATDVDFAAKEIVVVQTSERAAEVGPRRDRISYDQLVIAAGATTADYGIPGVEEHAFPLKSIEQSMLLRNHILRQFERADASPDLIDDEGALTFVVAGGGPTGVELSGAIAELVDGPLRRDHPLLDIDRVRIVIVEMLDTLLPPYSETSQRYAEEQLRRRGVEVRTGTTIDRIEDGRVVFESGEDIVSSTVVWTAGVRAAPLADRLGFEQTKGGRVVVEDDLSVPGHPDVWIIGDMAAATDPDGEPYPQLAPVAIQQGKHVAEQIPRRVLGRPTKRFEYLDKGTMATIGRNAATAELRGGINLTGFVAWMAWLFLHLLYLVGFRNRVAVLLSWTWNYLTYDRSARLILDSPTKEDERTPETPRRSA